MFYQYIKIKMACFDRSLKYYLPITQALNIFQVYQYFTIRGVSRIMEKYRHKLFLRGVQGLMEGPAVPVGTRGTEPPEAHRLYNRKGDVFDHFGSALNNMKFRLFCTLLTIPLQTNQNIIDYPDTFLTDGWMVTLLYTRRNFNELFIVFHLQQVYEK